MTIDAFGEMPYSGTSGRVKDAARKHRRELQRAPRSKRIHARFDVASRRGFAAERVVVV
jgi:hypothetical protein